MPQSQHQLENSPRWITNKDFLHRNIGWVSLLVATVIITGSFALQNPQFALQWPWALAGAIAGSGITYWYLRTLIQNKRLKSTTVSQGTSTEYHFFNQYLSQRLLERQNIALLLCNIDFFRQFNQTYGHATGDACLHQIYEALQQSVRKGDLVTRMNAATFVILLPNTDEHIAIQVAERVRSQIEQLNIPHHTSTVSQAVTISGGLAFCHADDTLTSDDLIEAATQLLSLSKHRGYNQVTNRLQGIFAEIPDGAPHFDV